MEKVATLMVFFKPKKKKIEALKICSDSKKIKMKYGLYTRQWEHESDSLTHELLYWLPHWACWWVVDTTQGRQETNNVHHHQRSPALKLSRAKNIPISEDIGCSPSKMAASLSHTGAHLTA